MYQCTAQFTTLHGLRMCDDIIVRHWETLYNNREHFKYSRRAWIVCFVFAFPWMSFFLRTHFYKSQCLNKINFNPIFKGQCELLQSKFRLRNVQCIMYLFFEKYIIKICRWNILKKYKDNGGGGGSVFIPLN